MMIKEEFNFENIKDYLYSEVDLLITGRPGKEERSNVFYNIWSTKQKEILVINLLDDNNSVEYEYYKSQDHEKFDKSDLTMSLPRILKYLEITNKNVLVDITGLNHVIIIYLTRVLLKQTQPKTLFAAYIRPQNYIDSKDEVTYTLTSKIGGIKAVPGFAKHEKLNQTLCAFLGFEGARLKGIIESVNDVTRTLPIVAFPSGNPHWYNITMWNSMDLLSNNQLDNTIHKCFSESIFEAVALLKSILYCDEHIVLAPIGTRPHSMACAIYASQNNNVRIIHDYAVESESRAEGVSDINIYHLTSFIETL